MFKLTIDKIYPPPAEYQSYITVPSNFEFDGISHNENMWQYVCKYPNN